MLEADPPENPGDPEADTTRLISAWEALETVPGEPEPSTRIDGDA
jgi:hypothetical protein